MSASSIQVTQGSGTRLATNSYTEGGQTVHDEKVILGEQYLPTYSVVAAGIPIATANDHLLAINAGASLNLYIRRIEIHLVLVAGAVNTAVFQLLRLTTLGSGGGAVTPRPYDTTDAAAGATARTRDTVKGTEGVDLRRMFIGVVAANPITNDSRYVWEQHERMKAIRVPAGTANGIVVKNIVAVATAQVNVIVEFDEASY